MNKLFFYIKHLSPAYNFEKNIEILRKKNEFSKKIQMILKENSLIVVLTNGFHGRSPFTELNERMLLFLQYIKSFNKLSFFNYKSFNK